LDLIVLLVSIALNVGALKLCFYTQFVLIKLCIQDNIGDAVWLDVTAHTVCTLGGTDVTSCGYRTFSRGASTKKCAITAVLRTPIRSRDC